MSLLIYEFQIPNFIFWSLIIAALFFQRPVTSLWELPLWLSVIVSILPNAFLVSPIPSWVCCLKAVQSVGTGLWGRRKTKACGQFSWVWCTILPGKQLGSWSSVTNCQFTDKPWMSTYPLMKWGLMLWKVNENKRMLRWVLVAGTCVRREVSDEKNWIPSTTIFSALWINGYPQRDFTQYRE